MLATVLQPDDTATTYPDCMHCRIHKGHATPNTDTEDTSDDSTLIGVPKYSHCSTGLAHQHWVDELLSGGGFGVHCTQAAEAIHKSCMKLPSERVRHLHANKTQDSMQNYLKYTYLFGDMLRDATPNTRVQSKVCSGVSVPISTHMPDEILSSRDQHRFLHPQIRLACFELLDMLCDQFLMRKSVASYRLLRTCHFQFGQKLTRSDGEIYWATDSRYLIPNSSGNARRRDVLRLQGVEQLGRHTNALCCEAVGFFDLFYLSELTVPDHLADQVQNGRLSFVIGRWFEPHSSAVERDATSRPVCPGPLHINHCLWRYAKARDNRRALVTASGRDTAAVTEQAKLFGADQSSQRACLQNERRAYYGLVLPANIVSAAHMCPCFLPNTSEPDYTTWLESVTIC